MKFLVLPSRFVRILCLAVLELTVPIHVATAQQQPGVNDHAPTLLDESVAALTASSPEVRSLYQKAREKLQKHDYAGAIADFTRLIEMAPRAAGAYNLRGLAKHFTGNQVGAEADFSAAIALSPRYPDPYLNRGNLKQDKGDFAGAATDYHHALEANPKYGKAYVGLGSLKFIQKDYPGAETDYGRALTLEPSNATAWHDRALARHKQDHDADAFADLNRAISLNPKDADHYNLRADIEHQRGDQRGALADLRRSLELDPKRFKASWAIGYIEAEQGRDAAALADVQRSIPHLAGREEDYAQLLAWILRTRLGQAGDADKQLSVYFARRPHTADGEWPGHVGAFLSGRESEESLFAHAKSGDSKKADGQRCEAWYYAGLKKRFAGDKAAAAAHFRQCVATGQKSYSEYLLARAELQTL